MTEGKGQVWCGQPEGKRRGGREVSAASTNGSAKHPCVHEIRVSTSDSCFWVVTVKQIMSAGGSGEIPVSCSKQCPLRSYSRPLVVAFTAGRNVLAP